MYAGVLNIPSIYSIMLFCNDKRKSYIYYRACNKNTITVKPIDS